MLRLAFLLPALLLAALPVGAFPVESCGEQQCQDCHTFSREEAKTLLGAAVDSVDEVNVSPVKGLWEVVAVKGGKRYPLYVDFARSHVVSGELIRLEGMENVTGNRFMELNKVDVRQIPLEDAVVLGSPTARHRLIVFDDPECPFCQKLFVEMQKIVAQRPDVAFFIKMFPLRIHPKAYEKSKSIVCAKSLQMLEDSLAGKDLPAPTCKTDAIDRNLALGQSMGIGSVPAIIYPDGKVVPGFASAERILQLLEQALASLPAAP